MFTGLEALDVIISYSIAEEGSNNMYLLMIQTLLTKQNAQSLQLTDVEMVLNYFPHSVFTSEPDMQPLRD